MSGWEFIAWVMVVLITAFRVALVAVMVAAMVAIARRLLNGRRLPQSR